MLQGLAIANQKPKSHPHKQKVSQKEKVRKKKAKALSNKQISAKYSNGIVFEGDPESIRLSAMVFYGTPYRFGGSSTRGFDCSAFVQKVFKANGINLPRDSRSQARYGYRVSLKELKPGDLLFFRTYKSDVSHVGIYMRLLLKSLIGTSPQPLRELTCFSSYSTSPEPAVASRERSPL